MVILPAANSSPLKRRILAWVSLAGSIARTTEAQGDQEEATVAITASGFVPRDASLVRTTLVAWNG